MSEQRATIDFDPAAHKPERRFKWIAEPRSLGSRCRFANVRKRPRIETPPVAVGEA
jgi:hypothetical protein